MARSSHGIDGSTLFQVGLLMGIITMGGGSLVTLSNETNTTGDTNEILQPERNPCPKAEDIFPCVCSYNERRKTVDMDCSNVISEVQLRKIFNKEFLYSNFTSLIIDGNKNLTILKEGDLGNASFTQIEFYDGVLTQIEDLTFQASWDTLTTLWIQRNELTSFPDICNFTRLADLRLYANKLTQFPFLTSTTLMYLNLGENNFNQIPVNAIATLPLLESFSCTDVTLTEIYSGTFSVNNGHLQDLDLGYNQLTTIPEDVIRLHGEHTKLSLGSNQLTSLPYEAVSGVTGILDVSYNQLTELPEKVYRPLLEKDVTVYLYSNPFDCGCDMAWLIENQTLLMKLPWLDRKDTAAPRCSDDAPFIALDPLVYHAMCDNETDGI